MLAIVVPVIVATLGFAWWFRASNTRATYWPDWAFSGQLELIVWAIPALVITFLGGIAWFGSHALDPFKPLASQGEAGRDRGRLARLEMAVHLPRRGRRQRQPARRPGRRARAFHADLDRRDEQLLRAAARQPDLHDGGHDLAAQPAGRRARDLSGPLGAVQRRRLLRHAFRRAAPCRPTTTPSGSPTRKAAGADARHARPTPRSPSRASNVSPRPIARSSPSCSNPSSNETAPPPGGAQDSPAATAPSAPQGGR